ncbi:MAG: trypsin-like peptidase domain-containing protein [Pseudomonadota bacterium]
MDDTLLPSTETQPPPTPAVRGAADAVIPALPTRHRERAATSVWSRRRELRGVLALLVLAALVAALLGVGMQMLRTADLEQRLAQAQARVGQLESGLQGLRDHASTRSEVEMLRDAVARSLVGAEARVSAVEGGSVAPVVAQVVRSVALIQGRYVLVDPRSTRPLRLALANGEPQRLPDGSHRLTLTGRGPVYSPLFTGTAFVVDETGTLLTNRHVALPWEKGVSAQAIKTFGVRPVLVELRGFLPGATAPFDVTVKGLSTVHDLALLRGSGVALTTPPLRMAVKNPAPGDAALVLGYPTGISALLARAGDAFISRLGRQPGMDDQLAADALAKAGMIQPLVSRGIVAQVSDTAVVYDAQTTSGGSGGPVINLRGEVLAITRAVLAGFSGSNLGVPVLVAQEMLDAADLHDKRKAMSADASEEVETSRWGGRER